MVSDFDCTDCNRETEIVLDHSTGDTICSECGLVLESHSVDETSEWRTFSDSAAADTKDPNRVGEAGDPLLPGQLSTFISPGKDSSFQFGRVTTQLAGATRVENRLEKGFGEMSNMADKLNLVGPIRNRAREILKRFYDRSCKGGRNRDSIHAACLYIACNLENLPRTLKEICSVANGATRTEIGRAKAAIMKTISDSDDNSSGEFVARTTTAGAKDFVKRFCSNLGIRSNLAMRAAQEAAETSVVELDVRRTPVTIAATVIYIISQLGSDSEMLTVKEIYVATGVSEGTIKSTYRDLYPNLGKIVPKWYANGVALRNLVSP